MSVRRSLLLLALLMVVLPPGIFALNSRNNQQPETGPDLSQLQSYAVTTGPVERVVSAIGSIRADQTIQPGFLVPGTVAEIYVNPGDYVFAGEPLVRLENNVQQIAYDQAVLAVERAQIQLDDTLAPVSEDDLTVAQANVDSAWGAYYSASSAVTEDDLRAAELTYQQALNAYNDLKAARDQAVGGYGSPNYNTLDAQTGAASFNAEIARLRLELLKTGSQPAANAAYTRVILAQRQYDQVAAGPTDFQIRSAELNLQVAESQLTRAETSLNRTTLTAPVEGVITRINTEVGSVAVPGAGVVELTDLAPLRLTVQVDEVDIRLVQPGMAARVELDALPEVSVPAQIERISLLGDNSDGIVNYAVDLTLDTTDSRVRVGMTAEANIIVDERPAALVVPNIYIRLDRRLNKAYVNLLRDDEVQEIEITLGLQGQDASEVLAGLQAGDVVVINPDGDIFSLFGN